MYNDKKIYYIKALTPIHAGAGQGLETVDMPIQRERHSNIPKIESSSLKGSIKSWIYKKKWNNYLNSEETKQKSQSGQDEKTIDEIREEFKKSDEIIELEKILGKDENADCASRAAFTDAKLLFFPIRSNEDVFKLVTCPYILNRLYEDLKYEDKKTKDKKKKKKREEQIKFLNLENTLDDGECICNCSEKSNKIFLEEYIFDIKEDKKLESLDKVLPMWDEIKNRVVIINNTEFIDLVTMYTEIITRNRIDPNTGTARDTGLFTEEYLPCETIMYFIALGSPRFDDYKEASKQTQNDKEENKKDKEVLSYLDSNLDEVFQVGGDATIGKGFVKRLTWKVGENKDERY